MTVIWPYSLSPQHRTNKNRTGRCLHHRHFEVITKPPKQSHLRTTHRKATQQSVARQDPPRRQLLNTPSLPSTWTTAACHHLNARHIPLTVTLSPPTSCLPTLPEQRPRICLPSGPLARVGSPDNALRLWSNTRVIFRTAQLMLYGTPASRLTLLLLVMC